MKKEKLIKLKSDFLLAVKDRRRWLMFAIELGIVILLIVADQLTKQYIYGYCKVNGDLPIIRGVIRFHATENTGAAFSMLDTHTEILAAISTVCSVGFIIFLFYSYPRKNKLLRSALVLIAAGAIGNVIDRLFLGEVRDFVYFELINFAVFNFADSCLSVGTVLLIIYVLFIYTAEEKKLAEEREAKKSIEE